MGLDIRHKIKFSGTQSELTNRLSEIRNKCRDLPFEEVGEVKSITITKEMIDTYHFWQDYCRYPENTTDNLNKRDQALKDLGVTTWLIINLGTANKLTPKREVVIFDLWPGEGCEGAYFYFIKNKTNNTWYASGFCKTQYAEHFIRCHLLIVDLYDMFKEKDFDIEVKDEGGYWETRDLKVLAKNLNDYTYLLLNIAGALKKQVEGTNAHVDCEIDKSQNIISID